MVCNYMRIVILQCKSCDPVLVLFCNYLGASDSFWGGFVGSKERQDVVIFYPMLSMSVTHNVHVIPLNFQLSCLNNK
jgi:hypothetical protein